MIILDQEIHTALHGAIRAVGRNHLVYDSIRTPAVVRRVMKVRPEGVNNLFEVFDFTHILRIVTTFNSRPLEDSGVLLR